MAKIIKILKEQSKFIAIVLILLVCSVAIALGIYAQVTHRQQRQSEAEKEYANYMELKNNFQNIFTNTINKGISATPGINYEELLYTAHHVKEDKPGKYSVEAFYPQFKGDSEVLKKINNDIYKKFGKEMQKIAKETEIKTTYNLNYVAYVNGDVISLVIMCKYKDGEKAQKRIVYCYNYDIKNDKLLSIDDLITLKGLNKKQMQEKVNSEIKKANDDTKSMSNTGQNIFLRDENSEIYKIENTPGYFLGENGVLYLVYAYGNDNYTNVIDLVIF